MTSENFICASGKCVRKQRVCFHCVCTQFYASLVRMEDLATKLFEINAVKFGQYKLKSGLISPIYFDLRVIVSYPEQLAKVSEQLWEVTKNAKFDLICGVPYTALPFATLISTKRRIPMLLRRKEAKDYGTKKIIEGDFHQGQTCIIIEDVVTSGLSILETAKELREVGLTVTDAVVLLDRGQGGKDNLAQHGITMHTVFTIQSFMKSLEQSGRVDRETVQSVMAFVKANQEPFKPVLNGRLSLSLEERQQQAHSPLVKRLFQIMMDKKTNLSVAADVRAGEELLALAERVGPYICLFKTHIDIIENFTFEYLMELQQIAEKHNFLIMEDRKFADIGNTTYLQYGSGVHRISHWAHIVTAHSLPGPGILHGISQGIKELEAERPGVVGLRGVALIAEMSCAGTLTTTGYADTTLKMADDHKDLVVGYVGQKSYTSDPGMIQMTPGVKLEVGTDHLGQNYATPETAVLEKGADVIITGRGVITAQDPGAQAQEYQKSGWEALMKRISK